MVQGGWKFQSPLYHFPYHYSIHSHFSPSWIPRGSGAAEKEGTVHSLLNFNMNRAKEKGGVYTLLWVYYRATITFCLFSPFSLHSLTLLTGSGGPPWWLDSITCDSFDLMSLFGSLYLFEQLRGNCVTLSVEDVLWQRTRWTEGTSRGSVAIINESYFPQHSQTLHMCTYSKCVYHRVAGLCMYVFDGGNKRGWWAPLPLGNSTVRCTLRSPEPTFIITFSVMNRSVFVCVFLIWNIKFRCYKGNVWVSMALNDAEFHAPFDFWVHVHWS